MNRENRCKVKIAKGFVTWTTDERISERFGTLCFLGSKENKVYYKSLIIYKGKTVHLFARYNNTELLLGEGKLFFSTFVNNEKVSYKIGIIPEPFREKEWLNKRYLYMLHKKLVELYIAI